MADVKISEIAQELGYTSKEIIEKANKMGLEDIKSPNKKVSSEIAAAIYEYVQSGNIPDVVKKIQKPKKDNASKKVNKKENSKKDEKKIKKEVKTSSKISEEKDEKITPIANPIKEEITQKEKEEIKLEEKLGSNLNLAKRRGLVIVKKKKEEIKEKLNENEDKSFQNNQNLSLSMIFSNSDENLKKKKKEKKNHLAVSKKENTTKMDLLSDKDFADISLDNDDEVVLPDFSIQEQQKPVLNKKQPNVLRQSLNNSINPFGESGIQRRSRKKSPKRVEKKENEIITSVSIPKEIRVYEFADKIKKNTGEIISKLFIIFNNKVSKFLSKF